MYELPDGRVGQFLYTLKLDDAVLAPSAGLIVVSCVCAGWPTVRDADADRSLPVGVVCEKDPSTRMVIAAGNPAGLWVRVHPQLYEGGILPG